ncbi:DUF2931 family protein [Chryseobacterium wangxinyae]|uniref:DUF2931 family protein n=1 Tax=Chryseobacterium sp. CY353 TaxID=2997334 RepID=UPI00226E6EE0|nr:DUF2931 family protein [Chryseobacterium sp. CY353]MCY0971105.1 DUF2931 family protein [Chryseobacterium sp. CY353]
MSSEIYDWKETISCPPGYPVEVYKGGLQNLKEGNYVSLNLGIHRGLEGWGSQGRSMDSGVKPLPDHLNVVYLSFAEDKFFQVDCDLDHEKIASLFRKGYESKGASGATRHENYNTVIVGFAPGGVCVIWIAGAGKQLEIGRYLGKEVEIPKQEIENLDSHNHLMFEPEYRKKMMKDPNIVPLALQGKPISYGLWDTYRNKYNWKPVFELQNEGRLRETRTVYLAYINGEEDNVLSENFPLKDFEKKAMPSEFGFGWKDQIGQSYSGFGKLNKESVFAAFKDVYGDNPDQITADLDIRVNMINTFFTVKLKGNGKDVFIKTDSIEIFKTDKK